METSTTSPNLPLDSVPRAGGEVKVQEEEEHGRRDGDGATNLEELEDDVVIYGTDYSAGQFPSQ